jgi:VCBS repeat-containing protein
MNGWRCSALLLLVFGLTACGGSGGGAPAPAANPSPPSAPNPSPPAPPPPAPVNTTPIAADDDYRVHRDDSLAVAAPGVLANDSDANGDALTVRLAGDAGHGTLTLNADGSFSYTPASGFTGTDEFSYATTDGTAESPVATVTIAVDEIPLLFSDSFSRATSAAVGNGWIEVEAAGASVVLDGTRLRFADTSEAVMRPLVTHRFSEVASGYLEWEFELDWTEIGNDDTYTVHMQLGNGAQMNADSPAAGVGIHLVWGHVGGVDQTLGYVRTGATTALMPLAGRATIRVRVDVDALAYDVYVDGQHVESGIPLETPVVFDTMRFFTDGVDEAAFSGRTFDSITVAAWHSDGVTRNSAPIVPDQQVWADDTLAKEITLSYTDGDGPGPYTFEIVDRPAHGTLGSDDGDATVVYTPTQGFIGTDSFTFRVGDGVVSSGLATMSVVVQHYPGAAWETRTPDQVGLRSAALGSLAASIGGVGSVVRNGYMVYTWGDQTEKADWASAAKPVMHTLLFFAVQENRIDSLDDRIGDWVLAGTGGTLRPEDESITFAQLMNMTSGYARIDLPGAAWAYNDVASNLKSRLIGAIFGEPLDAPLRERLAPLQFEDGPLLTTRGGYGVSTTPRDFARIGWFWMNRGNWRNQQVLSSTFFDEYMRTQVPGDLPRTAAPDADYLNVGSLGGGTDETEYGPGQFGASWWFNDTVGTTGLRAWPDAPLDMFQANGHWDREIVVMIPSLNLLVAARGAWGSFVPGDPSSGMNQRLRILTSAVVP